MFEKYTSAFSAQALKIAACTEGILRQGFNRENSGRVAQVIFQTLGIGAVSITDRHKVLAFIGSDGCQPQPGDAIVSPHSRRAIEQNQVVFVEGPGGRAPAALYGSSKPGATLVIPLRGGNGAVMGTIQLYEARHPRYHPINRALGEGIASLLSAQIVAGEYERHTQQLAQSEIKLLHAQVNPHFLFNALNTLVAVIRRDGDQAVQLVQYLSTFFRKNLKRSAEIVTLADEIEHVNAYLQIEKARFQQQLQVFFAIPPELLALRLPAFTLQPMVENAIKHGTSQLLGPGIVTLSARRRGAQLLICVEDNAGLYREHAASGGLGMQLVHTRLLGRYGEGCGVSVAYRQDAFTRITLTLNCEDSV